MRLDVMAADSHGASNGVFDTSVQWEGDVEKRTRTRSNLLSMSDIPNSTWESSESKDEVESKVEAIAAAYTTILASIGEDPSREGLVKTPLRAAKALCYFTKGYEETIQGNLRYRLVPGSTFYN